ncbi:GPW/gp25 family protein [Formicincola oecophyllae]|nr:GPW/gp25 family protein [Formicincola oecophyllae]
MDRNTGKALEGMADLRAAITDILTTPLGTRVMRRNYGSRLFELVDSPQNNAGAMAVYAAVVEALERWEPRLAVSHVQVAAIPGALQLALSGTYVPTQTPLRIDDLTINNKAQT